MFKGGLRVAALVLFSWLRRLLAVNCVARVSAYR